MVQARPSADGIRPPGVIGTSSSSGAPYSAFSAIYHASSCESVGSCWLSVTAFAAGSGASGKTRWRTMASTASFPKAVRENEEVVPVNVSTWVLPSGVMVGR